MFRPSSILIHIPEDICKVSLAVVDMDIADRRHVRLDIEFWDLLRVAFIWERRGSGTVVWIQNYDELKLGVFGYSTIVD